MNKDLAAGPCYSLARDESADISDVAQLCTWVRFLKNVSFHEEVLCIVPIQGQMRVVYMINGDGN